MVNCPRKGGTVNFPAILCHFAASYPSGLRGRFAKPLFAGSNPADASSFLSARVVELVDTMDLKSIGSNAVPVRVRPRVLVDKRL